MRIGSIWETGTDSKQFTIQDVKIIDDRTWIYYNNTFTRQNYSCLKEAFVNRFREKINNG
jgi:hypothetical protein